jgi:glycosyltransferase involved in cell wall biosynthesis
MAKVKILHLIKTLNLGGAERNLYNLIRAMDNTRFENHVGYSLGGEFESAFKKGGIRLFKFSEKAHRIKSPVSLVIIARIIKYVLKNDIDIIHTHTFNSHVWGAIAAKITGRKLVEHVHDFRYMAPEEFRRRRGTSTQYKYINCMRNISDKVVVLTPANREFVVSRGLYPPETVVEIKNGMSIYENVQKDRENADRVKRSLGIGPDKKIIATTCRMSPEKNVDLIFSIAQEVIREIPEAVFVIAGDGPLLGDFKDLKEEKGLDFMILPGFLSEVKALLDASDIFLLPSFLELHSIALLEAMALAIPPVISKGVGCHDGFIRNWENGVLLDPYSDREWIPAIVRLCKEDGTRKRIGENARKTCIESFNIEREAKGLESIYNELCRK